MSRSALVNDGFLAFVVLLVLLVLLLAMSFVAVIRVPRWAGSPSDQDTQDEPGHPVPSHAGPAQGGARPPGTQAGATGQSGEPDYPARHVTGPVPGLGTVAAPKVSGSPPWEPAPRPPGQEELVKLSRALTYNEPDRSAGADHGRIAPSLPSTRRGSSS